MIDASGRALWCKRGIVRGAGLRHAQAAFCHSGHIEVAEFCHSIFGPDVAKENVGGLNVTMKNVYIVECIQCTC
eukprot:1066170-Amphidinium_carterae.2